MWYWTLSNRTGPRIPEFYHVDSPDLIHKFRISVHEVSQPLGIPLLVKRTWVRERQIIDIYNRSPRKFLFLELSYYSPELCCLNLGNVAFRCQPQNFELECPSQRRGKSLFFDVSRSVRQKVQRSRWEETLMDDQSISSRLREDSTG